MLYVLALLVVLNVYETLLSNGRLRRIMATLDDLVAKVTALTAVDDSVVALLVDLKAKLDAAIASGDPAKIQAIADALGEQTQRLADAVTANTPSG
jgi:hypothetical protein